MEEVIAALRNMSQNCNMYYVKVMMSAVVEDLDEQSDGMLGKPTGLLKEDCGS
jgi:hypothetical protein